MDQLLALLMVNDMESFLVLHLDEPRLRHPGEVHLDQLDVLRILVELPLDGCPTLEDAHLDELDGWQVDEESHHRFER